MEFVADYGMFLLKALTVVAALAVLIVLVARMARMTPPEGGRLKVTKLNKRYQELGDVVRKQALTHGELREQVRRRRREEKERRRKARQAKSRETEAEESHKRGRVFVLSFEGDLRASAVESLRKEVTALLTVIEKGDRVVLRIDSGGGLVHAYGLAASQIGRLRDQGVAVTACVDRIAASGGYMMACVADRVVAAPFAVVGSIGVVATVPNFHRLLDRHSVDVEQIYAGEYKRTLSLFGENTDKGRKKFAEQIEETHRMFRDFVKTHRSAVDIEEVATGEPWYGQQAVDLGLVDELRTSDDVLLEASREADVYEVRYERRRHVGEKLTELVAMVLKRSYRAGLEAEREPHL
jgi:serine protease SohB